MELLADVRTSGRAIPTIVLTGSLDAEVANRAASHGALVAAKPCDATTFEPFLAQCLAFRDRGEAPNPKKVEQNWDQTIRHVLEETIQRHALTHRQGQVLKLHVQGRSRPQVIRHLSIAEKTYDNHVRAILKKTRRGRTSDLVTNILREALKRGASG
jgi:DNA-binding NarL/FixJ family response regulator